MASWIEIHIPIFKTPFLCVEAYVASWIEMRCLLILHILLLVEAYVASWIEIFFVGL